MLCLPLLVFYCLRNGHRQRLHTCSTSTPAIHLWSSSLPYLNRGSSPTHRQIVVSTSVDRKPAHHPLVILFCLPVCSSFSVHLPSPAPSCRLVCPPPGSSLLLSSSNKPLDFVFNLQCLHLCLGFPHSIVTQNHKTWCTKYKQAKSLLIYNIVRHIGLPGCNILSPTGTSLLLFSSFWSNGQVQCTQIYFSKFSFKKFQKFPSISLSLSIYSLLLFFSFIPLLFSSLTPLCSLSPLSPAHPFSPPVCLFSPKVQNIG